MGRGEQIAMADQETNPKPTVIQPGVTSGPRVIDPTADPLASSVESAVTDTVVAEAQEGVPPKLNKIIMVLAGLSAALLIAGAIYMLVGLGNDKGSNSNTNNPVVSTQDDEDIVEVDITDTGFSPSEISVTMGTEVRWTNTGTAPHVVSSNSHPEHDELADFDAVDPIGPGSTYTYKFTSSGTFGYHDHLNPTMNGKVTVE